MAICFSRYAAFVVAICASHAAAAAALSSFTSKEGNVVAVLKGEIVEGDADHLAAIIRASNAAQKLVSGVRLNSPGGNLAEGVKLADVIRRAKMATIVANGATCASACFVAFAAGGEKFVSNSAQVGVHGASENGAETAASSEATIAMARIVKDLGVPAAVLGKMVVTPPTQVVWLTANDLRAMGTTMTGKPSQVSSSSSASGATLQLPATSGPSTSVQANTRATWETTVNGAFALSAQQNGGTPNFSRVCQPELRVCTTAVLFKGEGNKSLMLRKAEDPDGNLISREACEFNSFGDVRKCFDWDKGTRRTDMKNPKGEWVEVPG